ncbi:MAG: hypothetical protein H7062_13210 [Candidatus Saccharimonas sp.]|nr:hypothetical protein [Planctomycetaceae bacterium]
MAIRRNPEPGRQAVTWLATAFVVVVGAASCAFIILGVVDQPTRPLLVWGSLFGGIVLFLASLAIPRDTQTAKSWIRFWLASRDKTDPNKVYRVGKKRSSAEMPLGTNQPPTLESVREAAEQGASVRWVPHGSSPEGPPS